MALLDAGGYFYDDQSGAVLTYQEGAAQWQAQNAPAPTPEQMAAQITQDYQSLLGRTPSADEISSWQQTMQQGVTPQQVQQGIATSPEFQQANQPFVQPGVDQSSAQGFDTGASFYQQKGYIAQGDYEGVPTAFYDPKTGKLAAWYGTTGGSATSDYSWHTPQQMAPGDKVVTAHAKAEDPQLKTGVVGALGVLATVLAPQIIGFIANMLDSGVVAAAEIMGSTVDSPIAAGIFAAGKGAADAVANGKDPYMAAVADGISAGLAPYLSSEIQGAISDPTGKAFTDYIMKVTTGAVTGGLTGGITGAEIGGFSSAATGALGAGAGALGRGIAGDIAAPDTMMLGDTEYVLDQSGNLMLDANGEPMTPTQYQDQAAKQFSSFAQKAGAPYISQNISSLFSSPSSSALSAPASTSSAQSTSPVTPTGRAAYSSAPATPSSGASGNTTSTLGAALGTQGVLGTQAQAQVLNLGNPATAVSDTGDTGVPTPETGGTPQPVWNTSSLRVKDATGSDTNV